VLQSFDTGGFASDSRLADLVKEGILQMCSQLKPEAVAVADSLAPPDFVLKSVIGKSDGKVCTVKTCSTVRLWVLVGQAAVCRFYSHFCKDEVRGHFRILDSEGHLGLVDLVD
jgi:hypothetical protein